MNSTLFSLERLFLKTSLLLSSLIRTYLNELHFVVTLLSLEVAKLVMMKCLSSVAISPYDSSQVLCSVSCCVNFSNQSLSLHVWACWAQNVDNELSVGETFCPFINVDVSTVSELLLYKFVLEHLIQHLCQGLTKYPWCQLLSLIFAAIPKICIEFLKMHLIYFSSLLRMLSLLITNLYCYYNYFR